MKCEKLVNIAKNGSKKEREVLAARTDVPLACSCRVLGILSQDDDKDIKNRARTNEHYRIGCRGGTPLDVSIENWLGFGAKKATVNCRNNCNADRIIGEMEAQNVDIVSVKPSASASHILSGGSPDFSIDEQESLKTKGFIFSPEKLIWSLKLPRTSDDYLKSVKKGKFMARRDRWLKNRGVKFVIDEKLRDDNLLRKWYDLYERTLEGKEKGAKHITWEDVQHKKYFTGIYAVENGEVLGGILMDEDKQLPNRGRYSSAGYGAFSRKYPGISDVLYLRMVERSIDRGVDVLTLGMDTNFYGYHLSPGLFRFKRSAGFIPHRYKINRYHFQKVLNPSRFDNPYMFIETDRSHRLAVNNVFLREEKQMELDGFDAKDGMVVHNQ